MRYPVGAILLVVVLLPLPQSVPVSQIMAQRRNQTQLLRQQSRASSTAKFGGVACKSPQDVVDVFLTWELK
jgi:hypothetical protein